VRAGAAVAAACLATLAVAAGPAAGQGPAADWRVERLERTWEIAAAAAVSLDNPWGDVAVRTHAAAEVYLLAHVQRHRDDPRELDLAVTQSDAALALAVRFATAGPEAAPDAWAKRRVDVTVFVPKAAATRFSTRAGNLEIRGTRAPTEAATETGDLRLRIAGPVAARTRDGDVLVQFLRTDWSQPVEISSLTGEIRVEMPRGGNAEVVVETRGEITSDFSTHVEWVQGTLLKRVRLSVGAAGMPLELSSHQGPIKVLQSLVPAEDGPAEDEPAKDDPAEDDPAEDDPAEGDPAEDDGDPTP